MTTIKYLFKQCEKCDEFYIKTQIVSFNNQDGKPKIEKHRCKKNANKTGIKSFD